MTYVTISGSNDVEKKESLAQAILAKAKEYGEISASRILHRYNYAWELGLDEVLNIFSKLESEGYGRIETRIGRNKRKAVMFILKEKHYWKLCRPFTKVFKGTEPKYESQNGNWRLIEDLPDGYLLASDSKDLPALIPGWLNRGWKLNYLGLSNLEPLI